jgi:hypothetical protein
MNNLFEAQTAQQIISRIQQLQPDAQPKWGKMSVTQMLAHCQQPFRAFFGEMSLKRSLVGILFGKMAKKKLLSDKPWSQNLPTAPEFKITNTREFEDEKQGLIQLVRRFTDEGKNIEQHKHPFFGDMTTAEWAVLHYRHLNHHLQQFGN